MRDGVRDGARDGDPILRCFLELLESRILVNGWVYVFVSLRVFLPENDAMRVCLLVARRTCVVTKDRMYHTGQQVWKKRQATR